MKRLALAALLLLPVSAYAEQTRLPLNSDKPEETQLGELAFLGAVVISPGADRIGGLSDLYVDKDAGSFLALSDTGKLHRGHLVWENGRLTGATVERGAPLRDEDGTTPTRRARFDSESFSRTESGDWLVGYERDHRIERYEDEQGQPGGTPKPLPLPPGLDALPRNEGLEALTALPEGRILAIAEAKVEGLSPAWLWQEGHWEKLSYEAPSGFVPVDAATLPNGDVLVLERSLNLFYGFRSQIALVKAADLVPGAQLKPHQLALLESPYIRENFEGIHAIAGEGGRVRVLILSDNNYNAIQQTILAAFELISDDRQK